MVHLLWFNWDKPKARANRRKHGVEFSFAARVFDDPYFAQIDEFNRYEFRYRIVGMIDGAIYVVVCADGDTNAETGEVAIRIISAREATPHEREEYEEGIV